MGSLNVLLEFDRHQEHDKSGQEKKTFKEQCQPIEYIHSSEREVSVWHSLEKTVNQDCTQAEDGHVPQAMPGGNGEPEIGQKESDCQPEHKPFVI
jgi:hypothetical protein